MTTMQLLGAAVRAKRSAALLTEQDKNRALLAISEQLESTMSDIIAANELDMANSRGIMSDVMLDRLRLDEDRIRAMAKGVRDVAALPDPVGEELERIVRDDGLVICKVRVPLGVVAIIYESRPNVTSDAAALCLKSGNVCVLRAGKEAHASAAAIVSAMKAGLRRAGLDEDLINLVDDTSRRSANVLMTAVGYVDLLIPRGGAGRLYTQSRPFRRICVWLLRIRVLPLRRVLLFCNVSSAEEGAEEDERHAFISGNRGQRSHQQRLLRCDH